MAPLAYREVTGYFTARIPDGGDSDEFPDTIPLTGAVTFTPEYRKPLVFPGEHVVLEPIHARIVDGQLMYEVVDGEEMVLQPLHLAVTADERANQTWSWRLSFSNVTLGDYGQVVDLPDVRFVIEEGDGQLDLSTVPQTTGRTSNAFITRGPRGFSIVDAEESNGEIQFVLDNGERTEPVPLLPGPANQLSVGTVTEGEAAATITGEAPSQELSLVIPRGEKGAKGDRGDEGPYGGTEVTDPQVASWVEDTSTLTGAWLTAAYRRSVSVLEYGADQNAADNTAAFQSALNDLPGGGEVFVPEGEYTFNNSSPMTVPSHVTVRGQGASLVQTRNGPLLAVEDGATQVAFTGLVIRGTMPDDLLATIQNQAGIRAYSTPDKPITQLSITHCRFVRMQGSGIQLKNVHDLRIQNNDIIHHGSSAIGCYSIKRGLIEGNVVEGTGQLPAYSSNCYGIFVSTLESDGPVGSEAAPRSTDVMVRGNIIRNQVWSALDTHVGKRISFIGNHLDGCVASGINAVFISTSGPNVPLSPQDIVIADNLITHSDRHEANPMLQQAILLRGSQALNDPSRELATGVIRGNVIRGYGRLADSGSGAIFLGSSLGVVVDGNIMLECRSTGVQVRDAKGTTVSNNTFVDLWRTTGAAVAVYLRIASDIHMDVTITGNKYVRGALTVGTDVPAGSSVNSSAIHGSADARIVTVEGSNEWGNASHVANIRRMNKSIASKSLLEGVGPPTGPKPGGGSWVLGDQIQNSDPEAGSPMGWVCVNGGSPGSWRSFGQIALT